MSTIIIVLTLVILYLLCALGALGTALLALGVAVPEQENWGQEVTKFIGRWSLVALMWPVLLVLIVALLGACLAVFVLLAVRALAVVGVMMGCHIVSHR